MFYCPSIVHLQCLCEKEPTCEDIRVNPGFFLSLRSVNEWAALARMILGAVLGQTCCRFSISDSFLQAGEMKPGAEILKAMAFLKWQLCPQNCGNLLKIRYFLMFAFILNAELQMFPLLFSSIFSFVFLLSVLGIEPIVFTLSCIPAPLNIIFYLMRQSNLKSLRLSV